MADSLFDNRYRYDYIYPRGRSGETLRAVDTGQDDQPVVVKRPAPNDAPPIRAGQEVSILNERKALKRLAGHPVLTDVLGEGQFFIGGQPHQYIVVERATGMIVADSVLSLSRSGERLPQLELLVIVDQLLDLLVAAHEKDVVYNDVDAKHLFWSREAYRLKVIDWGNAVFLEGDESTPQGISRQTDVYQVGELLYFVLSGGSRADVPRDAGPDFRIDFGDDVERVPRTLQSIISKALHPSLKLRYASVAALRQELADYRRPLERERDTTISHVQERLRRHLSKTELRSLQSTLEPVHQLDPGYPAMRKLLTEIDDRLRDLEVEADLDAVRIYMTGGNWARAADLLNELRDKTGPKTTDLVELLLDCTLLMLDADLERTPPTITSAAALMFEDQMIRAAQTLLTEDTPDDQSRKYQWLMAERISSRIPEILLLRPNLYRLALALNDLRRDGMNVDEPRALLDEIDSMLDAIPTITTINLSELRDSYRAVVDQLAALNTRLATLMVQERLPNRRLPLNALDRATNAAMALADNMHVIGKQAAASPRDALVALDSSRAIDPTTPLWERLGGWLNTLYSLLQSYQTYVPAADGSDLAEWLKISGGTLTAYTEQLFDEMLESMVEGLATAERLWGEYAVSVIIGDRDNAVSALATAAQAVSTVSPALSGWLNQLRSVVAGSAYVQRHAVFGGLGRALADGYEAFDRGRLPESEQLAQRAVEIAADETQKEAARRLLQLAGITREWIERGGVTDKGRSETALTQIEALYDESELRERERFAMQMPTRETYLKAMGKGLIETYQRHSTPALRVYYMNAVLLGTVEAHARNLDDATFWRSAAVRSMGDYGQRHPATQALDEFIERRRVINEAAARLNALCNKAALETLSDVRRTLTDSTEQKTLNDTGGSLRDFEACLRHWGDGDFKGAGMKLESAIHLAEAGQKAADIDLSDYIRWLGELQSTAADLHNLNRQMRQTVERRPAEPSPIVRDAHRQNAETTFRLLGEPYHAQLQNWHETYEQFLSIYTDPALRRSAKLERFNELFKAMFIDRHPAYDLYRHWYDLTESAPEFPAPPTSEPVPRIDEDAEPDDAIYLGSKYDDPTADRPAPIPARAIPFRLIGLILLVVLALGGAAFVALVLMSQDDDDPPVVAIVSTDTPEPTATPTDDITAPIVMTDPVTIFGNESPTPVQPAATTEAGGFVPPPPFEVEDATDTPTPEPTVEPSATSTPTATATMTPTVTPTPTNTPIPSDTPTPTITPSPTLPPQGIQGTQDLLALLDLLDADAETTWTDEAFSRESPTMGWRMGVAEATDGDRIEIAMDDDLLDTVYGNNAPARIRRMEANIAFTTYNPSVIDLNQVSFGAVLRSVNDPAIQVGIRLQAVNLQAVNIYIINGDEETFITQRSVNAIEPRLRFERDASNGNVSIFLDDAQIGEPLPFVAPEALVVPVLFVNDGGAIINVTGWRVTLR